MNNIICPKCGEAFKIDEAGYANIVKQVRDSEFEKELQRYREQDKKNFELQKELAVKAVEEGYKSKIADMSNRIENSETKLQLEVQKLSAKHAEQLHNKENEHRTVLAEIQLEHSKTVKAMETELDYYKNYKQSLSTKMIGESLEQHCLAEFNSIRMTAFPKADFEKDNDIKYGSKGDFIFCERDDDGDEILSIMFEMKNESNTTATKKKNEHFFKELDKDRREKNCEYAVLVSMLEPDSELYNKGIVDVSYKYDKMFVVRPQFFIAIISLLRNAALNTMKYKKEMLQIKRRDVDLTNFESNMELFKKEFQKNYDLAGRQFNTAIEEIDKTIDHLKTVKANLLKSENNLRLANNTAQEKLTVEKLTKNAPSVKEQILNSRGKSNPTYDIFAEERAPYDSTESTPQSFFDSEVI